MIGRSVTATAASGSPRRWDALDPAAEVTEVDGGGRPVRRRPMSEPDLLVVLGPPTQLPPSLVWELAYAELVFIPVAWSEFGAGELAAGGGRLRRSPPPVRRTRRRVSAEHERASCTATTGVVLRTYKLAESDRIVVIMTAEHGKVRAVAKGVRKTKSKFGARLEPMSHVRLLLYRGRELDIVSQAESIEPLSPMLSSLDRASQGMAAIEAVDQLALEREPNPRLYRMAVGVLRTIAARPSPLNVSAFYWKLLAAEGLEPQLDACVRCGESGPDVRSSRSTSTRVASSAGTADRATAISPAALAIMRDILGGRLNEALALRGVAGNARSVGTLATRALEHHIERRLRAVAMFERH